LSSRGGEEVNFGKRGKKNPPAGEVARRPRRRRKERELSLKGGVLAAREGEKDER